MYLYFCKIQWWDKEMEVSEEDVFTALFCTEPVRGDLWKTDNWSPNSILQTVEKF